jgi:hypothetical protein
MISKVFKGTNVDPSKRDLRWFSMSGTLKDILLDPISDICDAIYWYVCIVNHHSTMINMFQFYIFYCSNITTNLQNKKLSIKEVDDWKVTISNYAPFPTISFTFDKVSWENIGQL